MKYRAGVIGLGWMGMLGDLAPAIRKPGSYHVDDVDRPMPEVDPHCPVRYWTHPAGDAMPATYAEVLSRRPDVELAAGADRDKKRLQIFRERYGVQALYTDAEEMLRKEKLDILGIATNVKGRADLVCLAVECGAKGILAEKPMCHALSEADRMVQTCAEAGVPLVCGALPNAHPSFAKAKELIKSGAIGEFCSMETGGPTAQYQDWSYFLDSAPAWVVGMGDQPRQESGSDEFRGQGILAASDGLMVHFRRGVAAPGVHISGTEGELLFSYFDYRPSWRLWQKMETLAGKKRVEMPWPEPQFMPGAATLHAFADIFDCLDGQLDEPKNSGRRVAVALEVELALKLSSAKGGARIDLPLHDRSLGLNYDWFR